MLRTANFRLSGQKLFYDFKNPFKILAEAELRLWRGEATIAQNPNSENWRCLLVKIRTFFDENPDCEFWLPSFARQEQKLFCSGGQKGRGLGGRNFCPPSLSPLLFSPPQFFVFRFAKCAAKECCPCPARPYAGNNKGLPKICLLIFIKFGII